MREQTACGFDAIVIGSGIGGLACACALTRMGYKVLVLEQHSEPGGLTQTFNRNGFTFDVGLHYLGEMGEHGSARKVLDWLSNGAIQFASVGPVYDTIHFPGNFEIQFARPEAALKLELKERFPASHAEIDAFFVALAQASAAGYRVFAERAMPRMLSRVHRFWHATEINKWWGRSTEAVLNEMISDPRLRAVLCAQRGDYGPDPRESSFGMHAIIMRHYLGGAYYPVGGSKSFASALIPVIEQGGGKVRTRAQVTGLTVENGAIAGVLLKDGTELGCPLVFSDVGAHNTILKLLSPELRESAWAREMLSLKPSAAHVQLYLGLEGDIHARGATSSNHWFYETWDIGAGIWCDPAEEQNAPAIFVSFPSLKDSPDDAGSRFRHTAEVAVFTSWKVFSPWEDSKIGRRPAEYLELKQTIEDHLTAQFERYFPGLASLIVFSELSTPLSTVAFTGALHGGVYGLEASPRRFLSRNLRASTPVRGLYLSGQDVASTGVTGAMMGGMLAAAALEPRVLRHVT
ncbi:MAG TPA: NAD(P)/FAD-dependent oxidoreductase [Steroidobacteraceae bacterium]